MNIFNEAISENTETLGTKSRRSGPKPGNDHKEAGLTTDRLFGHRRERREFAHERKDREPNQLQKSPERRG